MAPPLLASQPFYHIIYRFFAAATLLSANKLLSTNKCLTTKFLAIKSLSIVAFVASFLVGCDKADPDVIAGETIVIQNCKVCHAPGLNNAPVLGNKVMWKPRVEQGLETLVEHASNGYGLMPAKGGNEALTEVEITQGIKYMLSLLESE